MTMAAAEDCATKTPPRHNYASQHTPIASAKRPRGRGAATSDEALSPMHKPKPLVGTKEDTASWVGRKVDALFSPVLRYLEEDGEGDSPAPDTDTQPSSSCSDEPKDDDSVSIQGQEMPESDEFNPWQFIKSLPPYESVRPYPQRKCLPDKASDAPPVTLVLDLDETLVHCSVDPVDDPDLTFSVEFNRQTYQVHVKLRPHLVTFLEAIKDKFEVVLFTASQKIYANELLNRIDPDNIYIQHRLYRESCLVVEGNFLKDLEVLGRNLNQTILVDNSPHAFGYQVNNGIPIESWFDDPADRELLKLERFLRSCQHVNDVRDTLRKKFHCHELVENAPPLYMEVGNNGLYDEEEEE